jgi:hypothetical protein
MHFFCENAGIPANRKINKDQIFFMMDFASRSCEDTISAFSTNELHLLVYCGAGGLGIVLRHHLSAKIMMTEFIIF